MAESQCTFNFSIICAMLAFWKPQDSISHFHQGWHCISCQCAGYICRRLPMPLL